MKRWLLLLAVCGFTATCAALALVWIPGSGQQLARRLDSHWTLGELQLVEPRRLDLDTVAFERLEILDAGTWAGQLRGRVVLEDVRWRRGALFTPAGDLRLQDAVVRFERGQLNLVLPEHWVAEPASWAPRQSLLRALPGRLFGERCDLQVRRLGAGQEASLEVIARHIAVEATPGGGRKLRAEFESPAWREALCEWNHRTQDPGFRLHVADLDLTALDLAQLATLLPVPWPSDFPRARGGRADLDWEVSDAAQSLVAQHYGVDLGLGEGLHPLRYLTGQLRLTPERLSWSIESGRYSQSLAAGSLEGDLLHGRVQGRLQLFDILGDRGIGYGFPAGWSELIEHLPLRGRCDVDIELEGFLGVRPFDWIRRITLRFSGVSLAAESPQRNGPWLEGVVQLEPGPGGWRLEGETAAARVAGLLLPASRWQGHLDATGVRLERAGTENPRLRLDLGRSAGAVPTFRWHGEALELGAWLGLDLGAGRGAVHLDGTWDASRGFAYEGWWHWQDLGLGPDLPWPDRRPRGDLQGQLLFRRHQGQLYLPAIAVRDPAGLWLARGWVDARGDWRLDGVTHDEPSALPFPAEVPDLVAVPRDGWRTFSITGPLLDWKMEYSSTP